MDTRTDAPAELVVCPRNRYGEGQRLNPSAIAITAGVHVLLALALLGLGAQVVSKKRDGLTVVELSASPTPAVTPAVTPARAPQPDDPAQPRPLTLQPPAIVLPNPQVQAVPVTIDLTTPPQVIEIAAPAAPAPVTSPAPPAQPAPPTIVQANNLGTRMIAGEPPRYPIESRRRKEQGVVHLALILGADGRVESISVERSSGHDRLDTAALKAVRNWRWEPTLRDGVAARVRGIVEIPFVLQAAG